MTTPPLPLSLDLGVIEGQTKKQIIKLSKNTNFERFLPLFILMLLEGAFFIQLI